MRQLPYKSWKPNHPNPRKPHITRCKLLLLRQQEFLARNLASDWKARSLISETHNLQMGKRHRSDLGELNESISTQLWVADVEHKLLLQLHLHVRHHGVATSSHEGRQRQETLGRSGGCTRSKISRLKEVRKTEKAIIVRFSVLLKDVYALFRSNRNVKINASLYLSFLFGLVSLITYHF